MVGEQIPDDVRRFIAASIPSVPYLEALLLLRSEPALPWSSKQVAQRLYMSEKIVDGLLADLHSDGMLMVADQATSTYRYCPDSDELRQVINLLADTYAKHLVEVTHLIHSKINKQAQQFADAFKWRKDS